MHLPMPEEVDMKYEYKAIQFRYAGGDTKEMEDLFNKWGKKGFKFIKILENKEDDLWTYFTVLMMKEIE